MIRVTLNVLCATSGKIIDGNATKELIGDSVSMCSTPMATLWKGEKILATFMFGQDNGRVYSDSQHWMECRIESIN